MHYKKSATTIEKQITLLRGRGMLIDDKDSAVRHLEAIGYYRLSAYWLVYEIAPEDGRTRSKKFKKSTSFEEICKLYVFDRKFRVLLMEAIERIEINVRSRWTNRLSLEYGAHVYLDSGQFNSVLKHADQLVHLGRAIDRSNEVFIEHYNGKYRNPALPPLWAVSELMSLGELSKWISITKDNAIRAEIARDIGFPTRETFEGVLQVLAYVRNICAHHGRLWNRRLVKRIPKIKRMQDDLIFEAGEQKQTVNLLYNVLVVVLTIIKKQNTDTTYLSRLKELVETLSDAQRAMMGFPDDWRERPAWNP